MIGPYLHVLERVNSALPRTMVLGAAGQAFFERLVTEPGSARKTMEMTLYRRGGDFRQKKDADLCILKAVMISLEYQQHSHDPREKTAIPWESSGRSMVFNGSTGIPVTSFPLCG